MKKQKNEQEQFNRGVELRNYISTLITERGLSMRQAAIGIGISPTHLNRVMDGKLLPEAGLCTAMAKFFGVPVSLLLKLAGWLPDEALDPDLLGVELASMYKVDETFRALCDRYKALQPENRPAFAAWIWAYFWKVGTK